MCVAATCRRFRRNARNRSRDRRFFVTKHRALKVSAPVVMKAKRK